MRPEARALEGLRLNFFAEEIGAPVEEEEEAVIGQQMSLFEVADEATEEGDEEHLTAVDKLIAEPGRAV